MEYPTTRAPVEIRYSQEPTPNSPFDEIRPSKREGSVYDHGRKGENIRGPVLILHLLTTVKFHNVEGPPSLRLTRTSKVDDPFQDYLFRVHSPLREKI